MRFGVGTCNIDNGPAIPIVYDTGSEDSTKKLYGPYSRGTEIPLEPIFFSDIFKKV